MSERKSLVSAIAAVVLSGLVAALALINPVHEPQAVAQPKAAAASELDLVPADAVAFAHVRLADIWNSELMASLRATLEKAGPKALAALDEQLVPPPSAFDRATVFVTFGLRGPEPIGIIAFSKTVAPEQLVKTYLPQANRSQMGDKTVYVCKECNLAAYFPSNRQVVMGEPTALESYLSKPVAAEGNMKAALALAASRPLVVAANLAAIPIPPEVFRGLAPPLVAMAKAQTITLTVELAGDPRIVIEAGYKDAAAVDAAERSIADLQKLGKEQTAKARAELEGRLFDPKRKTPRPPQEYPDVLASVMGIGAMNRLDELIDNPGIKKTGNALTFDATIPKELMTGATAYSAVAVGLLLPAVQKVREAASRAQSTNNIKQLALAMHNHASANGDGFPPAAICDKAGKPLLSWRVAMLPYIEGNNLYSQFKLDEPWDSEHNKKLIPLMPKTYTDPRIPSEPGKTYYKVFTGGGAAFEIDKGPRLFDITDGTSNTIMIVEGGEPVSWTKPEDIPYDPNKPLPKLEIAGLSSIIVAMCDGSVRQLNNRQVSEKTMRAAITKAGGEILGMDW